MSALRDPMTLRMDKVVGGGQQKDRLRELACLAFQISVVEYRARRPDGAGAHWLSYSRCPDGDWIWP